MAALASALGLDGWALLSEEDPGALVVRQALVAKTRERMRELDRERAILIAEQISKLFPRKRGR